MSYDYTELNTTIDSATTAHLVRLQYDLVVRLHGLELRYGMLNDKQRIEDYIAELKHVAQAGQLSDQQLNAYESFWDNKGRNPTYQMIGMMFDLFSPQAMPLDEHFNDVLRDYCYAVAEFINRDQNGTLKMSKWRLYYEEEHWVNDRLKWLLSHHEASLWELEPAPNAQRLDHFTILEVLEFIKDQRTYSPKQRQTFDVLIDQPSDTRQVWLCHIPALNLEYVPIAEPAQNLSRADTDSWYRDFEWSRAVVRVCDPQRPAAFIMTQEIKPPHRKHS